MSSRKTNVEFPCGAKVSVDDESGMFGGEIVETGKDDLYTKGCPVHGKDCKKDSPKESEKE